MLAAWIRIYIYTQNAHRGFTSSHRRAPRSKLTLHLRLASCFNFPKTSSFKASSIFTSIHPHSQRAACTSHLHPDIQKCSPMCVRIYSLRSLSSRPLLISISIDIYIDISEHLSQAPEHNARGPHVAHTHTRKSYTPNQSDSPARSSAGLRPLQLTNRQPHRASKICMAERISAEDPGPAASLRCLCVVSAQNSSIQDPGSRIQDRLRLPGAYPQNVKSSSF